MPWSPVWGLRTFLYKAGESGRGCFGVFLAVLSRGRDREGPPWAQTPRTGRSQDLPSAESLWGREGHVAKADLDTDLLPPPWGLHRGPCRAEGDGGPHCAGRPAHCREQTPGGHQGRGASGGRRSDGPKPRPPPFQCSFPAFPVVSPPGPWVPMGRRTPGQEGQALGDPGEALSSLPPAAF